MTKKEGTKLDEEKKNPHQMKQSKHRTSILNFVYYMYIAFLLNLDHFKQKPANHNISNILSTHMATCFNVTQLIVSKDIFRPKIDKLNYTYPFLLLKPKRYPDADSWKFIN